MRPRLFILGALAALAPLAGCVTQGDSNQVILDAPRYPEAFEAAKRVLRDERFTIDRVDARAGVITTRPKTSGGLITPWDSDQSSFQDELEDAVNFQQRRVRVTFMPHDQASADALPASSAVAADEPASTPATDAAPTSASAPDAPAVIPSPDEFLLADDLRTHSGPLRAVFTVYLERINRPGRQLTPKTTRVTTFSPNPLAREGGVSEVSIDEALSRRLAAALAAALAAPAPAPNPDSPAPQPPNAQTPPNPQ